MGCGASVLKSSQKADPASLPKKEGLKDDGLDHAKLIVDKTGKISEFYDIEKKKLGQGSFGSVSVGRNKHTGQIRAVKTVSKAEMKNVVRFKQEIAIMKFMDHPNIIKLYETFEDHRNIYLCMELCPGGELFDRIIDAGAFDERQAAILMTQILRAIHYMHGQKVCHRDLKPENFLFTTKEPIDNNVLKLIDFGLACKFTPGRALTTKAGTPYYVAPQVLAGDYDQLSDVWSCGVIMYVFLCGFPPFAGSTDKAVLAKVRSGKVSFKASCWDSVSEDAKSLILCLLMMNPKDRYTAEQALNHVWVRDKAPRSTGVSLERAFVDNLRGFRSQNKLKKAALHVIAGQLNEGQIEAMRDIFMALDHDNDGQLTVDEMREGIRKCAALEVPADFQEILEDADSDGSGFIDYTEFLAATLDKRHAIKEDVCWSAFRVFDRNGDGKISIHELKAVLGEGDIQSVVGKDTIEKLIHDVDTNSDGVIDFQEFMKMMQGSESSCNNLPET